MDEKDSNKIRNAMELIRKVMMLNNIDDYMAMTATVNYFLNCCLCLNLDKKEMKRLLDDTYESYVKKTENLKENKDV